MLPLAIFSHHVQLDWLFCEVGQKNVGSSKLTDKQSRAGFLADFQAW